MSRMGDPDHGRRAYICSRKHKSRTGSGEEDVPVRVFLHPGEPVPRCPEHGNTMEQQPNNRYMGQKV